MRPTPGGAPRALLAATVLAAGVSFVDTTAVAVAVPAIGRDLGAGLRGLQWTVDAYVLALASLMIVGGALGDRLGRRRVFLAAILGFAAASLLCAAAPDTTTLIAARALQGTVGAALMPNALAVLREGAPAEARARLVGAWTAWGGVFTAAGPLVGGELVDASSWRAVFLLNLPLLAAAFVLARRAVPALEGDAGRSLDWRGAATLVAGLAGLTGGLIERRAALALAGLAGLAAVPLAGRRARDPLVPRAVLAPPLAAANAATLGVFAAMGGWLFVFPLFLQNLAGWSAFRAGLAAAPVSLCVLLLAAPAGRLAGRGGARLPVAVGAVAIAAGLAWLAGLGTHPGFVRDLLAPVLVLGAGFAIVTAALTLAVVGGAPAGDAGVAAALNTTLARIGGLLAVAAVGVVASAAGAHEGRALGRPPPGAAHERVLSASLSAYHHAMLAFACAALVAATLGALGMRGSCAGPRGG